MQPPSVVTMDTSVLDSVPNHIKTPENLELKISTKHDQKSVGKIQFIAKVLPDFVHCPFTEGFNNNK